MSDRDSQPTGVAIIRIESTPEGRLDISTEFEPEAKTRGEANPLCHYAAIEALEAIRMWATRDEA